MSPHDPQRVVAALDAIDGVRVRRDVALSENTTWRIGGPARLWIDLSPNRPSYDNVRDVVATLRSYEVGFCVVGGGSNILGADEGYDGAVIHLLDDDSLLVFDEQSVTVSADVLLSHLVTRSAREGWTDLEFLTGIPGTVGGALAMNAGTGTQWIGSTVKKVTVLVFDNGDISALTHPVDRELAILEIAGDALEWDYRCGTLRDRAIILQATLALSHRDEPQAIAARIRDRLESRRAGQPLDLPSAGSVFRNPPDDNAWRLVDAVGLKGHAVGGAQISEKHTNFIINRGDARASDVLALIETAQDRVYEEYGVRLQKEVRVLGPEA
jgi:UDP-N-acetylmuramate dehydrogenase